MITGMTTAHDACSRLHLPRLAKPAPPSVAGPIGGEARTAAAIARRRREALEAEIRGELPLAYVARVTRAKLKAARERLKRRGLAAAPVLCADTTVALGRRILGKPNDARACG